MPPRCAQVDVWVPAQVAADGLPKGGLFTTHNGLPPDASQRRNFRLNNLTGLLAFRATTDPRVEALLRRRPVAVLNLGDLDYPRPHDLRARPWLSAARRPRGNPPQTRPSLGLSTRRLPAASPRPRPLSESPRVGPAASPRPRPLGASPKLRRDIYSQRNLRFTRRATTFGDCPQVPVFTTNAPDQIATDPALRVAPAARRSDVAFVSGRRSRRVSTELRRRGRGVAATTRLYPCRINLSRRLVGVSANASSVSRRTPPAARAGPRRPPGRQVVVRRRFDGRRGASGPPRPLHVLLHDGARGPRVPRGAPQKRRALPGLRQGRDRGPAHLRRAADVRERGLLCGNQPPGQVRTRFCQNSERMFRKPPPAS